MHGGDRFAIRTFKQRNSRTEEFSVRLIFCTCPLLNRYFLCSCQPRQDPKRVLGADLISFHTHIHMALIDCALELSKAKEEGEIIQA
jgi:hypothetical protein